METKTYPKGTTAEQWERYYEDLKRHQERVIREEPMPLFYNSDTAYKKAYSEWQMMASCDAPNEPGYYRANND